MAHNLDFNEQTGKHSFFSVKEKAWHGLGQIVEGYPTSAEALKFAGLDYTVAKENCLRLITKTKQPTKTSKSKFLKLKYPIILQLSVQIMKRCWA